MLAGIDKNLAQEAGLPGEILGHTTRRCWMDAGAAYWKEPVKGALPTAQGGGQRNLSGEPTRERISFKRLLREHKGVL